VAASFSISACVSLPTISPNPANPIKTIAVLPLVNNTNDVDGPRYVREELAKELPSHYYVVRPIAEVDQILKDRMGITLGSQLDMTTPKQLGEVLGVDGVLYGALDDFSHTVTGVYNVKRVRLRVKLVNCTTGETVWKNGIGVKSTASAGLVGGVASLGSSLQDRQESEEAKPLFGDSIAAPWHTLPEESNRGFVEGLAVGLAEKVASKALGVPLKRETVAAVKTVLNGYFHDGGWFSPMVPYGQGIPPGSAGSVQEVYRKSPGLPGGEMLAGPMVDTLAAPMFAYAFSAHGYWLGSDAYRPGEWTRWRVVVHAGQEQWQHELEKAYLKKEPDGKEWWRVAYVDNDGGAVFEALFTSGLAEMIRLRGRVNPEAPPMEFPVTSSRVYQKPKKIVGDELQRLFVRSESVTVPAGTFSCRYYVYSPTPSEILEWWISDQVPGGIVKFVFREGKGAPPGVEMVLVKFGQNAKTVLSSY
jgi:hypothetical protein